MHCGNTPEYLTCFLTGCRICLHLERPLHKQISESNCTSYSKKGVVAQTHVFWLHKAAASTIVFPLKNEPSFLVPSKAPYPLHPLSQTHPSTHPVSPGPTPVPPNLLSHNRKSFGASAMAPARLRPQVGRAQRPFLTVTQVF